MTLWRRLLCGLAGLALATQAALAADGRDADAPGRRELIGRVVRAEPRAVYLEHMGAVVAFKITKDTEFTGLGGTSSLDLTEGQQVLATFTVDDTTNVARRISATSEAVGEPRSSGPRGETSPPTRPRDLPGSPDRGSTVPRGPPEQPVPRDPGIPLPR